MSNGEWKGCVFIVDDRWVLRMVIERETELEEKPSDVDQTAITKFVWKQCLRCNWRNCPE